MLTLIRNAHILDTHGDPVIGAESDVLIEDDVIREVSARVAAPEGALVLDARGLTLMPGLIDLHAHVTAATVDLTVGLAMPSSRIAFDAISEMANMLHRGFTTVRDAAGADLGLAQLASERLVASPRLLVSGRAISQSAGHGDLSDSSHASCTQCSVHRPLGAVARVADGADDVRRAVRQELRAGANQIKVMASGGVASPSDPLLATQFSAEELHAAVEEATAWGTYVMAHAYSAEAIQRAVDAGVRSIEHANLIDHDTAQSVRAAGAYVVPTLVAYRGLVERGRGLGLGAKQLSKLQVVLDAGLASLEVLFAAGVPIGFGSDLLGPLRDMQSLEFEIRADVLPAAAIVASATSTAAEILGETGRLGVIAPGAYADLLAVDGDPLADVRVLAAGGASLRLIMRGGEIIKNELAA